MLRSLRRGPRPGALTRAAGLLGLLLAMLAASPAAAHNANPNFNSVLNAIRPAAPGLKVDVMERGDHLSVRNQTGHEVDIPGYKGEPYVRMRANGAVEVNKRSPAWYINQAPDNDVAVPASADAKAKPRWSTVDRAGRFEFHDHRIHWMGGERRPPQVKDPKVKTKVFDWTVPVRVNGRPVAITGTLFWTPRDDGGFPVAAIVALVLVLLAAIVLVVVVRRRRGLPGEADGSTPATAGSGAGPDSGASPGAGDGDGTW